MQSLEINRLLFEHKRELSKAENIRNNRNKIFPD